MKYLLLLILFLLINGNVYSQEHEHGVNNLPDWYDPACCNKRDCRPVENDNDIEFGTDANGTLIVTYKPTGSIFYKNQFKLSQDERYHVCISELTTRNNKGDTTFVSLCFYDRTGA